MPIAEGILHGYPYPIAKSYERLIRARSGLERRDHVRYLFEVTIKYCACVAIAEYLQAGRSDPATSGALTCLSRPSLGHWLNLLRACSQHAQQAAAPQLWAQLFRPVAGCPRMSEAMATIRSFLGAGSSGPTKVSPFKFAEAMVAYRNRTVGHGAPASDQIERATPVIESGMLELLEQLPALRDTPLAFLAEIRVERRRFIHSMVGLMGTSQVPLSDYVTASDEAVLGGDRTVVLLDATSGAPLLSLHPLIIYANEEVFLLQQCDLRRTVEYLCQHTGTTYQADHIFEDFKDKFASFVETVSGKAGDLSAEELYENCLSVSLTDGVLADQERAYLDDLASRLALPKERTDQLEAQVRLRLAQTEPAEPKQPDDRVGSRPITEIALAISEQNRLLRELGEHILAVVASRPDPSLPMRLPQLADALKQTRPEIAQGLSVSQLGRLVADIQNHGCAPGLVRGAAGLSIAEGHIAYKLTREKGLKSRIAKAAVRRVQSGMRIGLDGGSTTLPIAEELVVALDAEILSDLTVVTNSIPVVTRFADFVERRGWTDAESSVRILLCGGKLRAVTEAIAEIGPGTTLAQDSLRQVLETLGGLDLCFVGGNGFTAEHGVTMPTDAELGMKRLLLTTASSPFVVADISKCGMRHAVRIVGWDERFTLLTNRACDGDEEMAAILARDHIADVRFAEDELHD